MKYFKLNSVYTYKYDTLRQCPMSDITEDEVKYLMCTKFQLYFFSSQCSVFFCSSGHFQTHTESIKIHAPLKYASS